MRIQETKRDGVVVVQLDGQLHASSVNDLEETLNSISKWDKKIEIDCENLDYISSAGIGVLIVVAKLLEKQGGKLVIVGPNDRVRSVFDMVGLSALLPIHKTHYEAIRDLK